MCFMIQNTYKLNDVPHDLKNLLQKISLCTGLFTIKAIAGFGWYILV